MFIKVLLIALGLMFNTLSIAHHTGHYSYTNKEEGGKNGLLIYRDSIAFTYGSYTRAIINKSSYTAVGNNCYTTKIKNFYIGNITSLIHFCVKDDKVIWSNMSGSDGEQPYVPNYAIFNKIKPATPSINNK